MNTRQSRPEPEEHLTKVRRLATLASAAASCGGWAMHMHRAASMAQARPLRLLLTIPAGGAIMREHARPGAG